MAISRKIFQKVPAALFVAELFLYHTVLLVKVLSLNLPDLTFYFCCTCIAESWGAHEISMIALATFNLSRSLIRQKLWVSDVKHFDI